MRQVAAAVDDTLDANGVRNNAEENQVTADDGQPGAFANLGAKLIEEWMLPDLEDRAPDSADEQNRALRTLFGDEIGDRFEIAFDKPGEFQAHP
jgi:hypothetical protein